MRYLDLFAGLGGWTKAPRERGHDITTLDFDARFGCDFTRDILTVASLDELERGGGRFDAVLASPPCEKFSVMTISRNWRTDATGHAEPITDAARLALRIARHTFDLIERYAPTYYVVENPRGMLRKVAPRRPTATTWYCRWGMPYAKPTDLWTNIAGDWPSCRNGGADHDYQPRSYGAKVAAGVIGLGTQGRPDNRVEIRAALERGERVPGWGLRPSGELRKRTALEMTTSGTRPTFENGGRRRFPKSKHADMKYLPRGGEPRRPAFADALRARTGDTGGGPKDPRGAALRALIPAALSLAVCIACETGGVLRRDTTQMELAQ